MERRRQVADGLRDIVAVLNSNQSLEDILSHITEQACRLLHADASAIFRIQNDQGHLSLQASYGLPDEYAHGLHLPPEAMSGVDGGDDRSGGGIDLKDYLLDGHAAMPTVLHMLARSPSFLPARPMTLMKTSPYLPPLRYQAVFSVPLVIKEEVYGNLTLYYREPRKFSAEEIELASTVGDQTALAIENARLRTQVERTAIAPNAAASPATCTFCDANPIFRHANCGGLTAAVGAQPPRKRKTPRRTAPVDAHLAEMRTLLLELRPATLIEVELTDMLRQLTEAITGRAAYPLHSRCTGTAPCRRTSRSPSTTSHKRPSTTSPSTPAGNAAVTLKRRPDRAHLTVKDDGRGFVIDKVTPEHLGLTIMHERAEAIGMG